MNQPTHTTNNFIYYHDSRINKRMKYKYDSKWSSPSQ